MFNVEYFKNHTHHYGKKKKSIHIEAYWIMIRGEKLWCTVNMAFYVLPKIVSSFVIIQNEHNC